MVFWSISPAILIVAYFFLRDRFKEPPRIVVYTFVLGVLSIIPISFLNIYLDLYGDSLNTSYFAKEFYFSVLRAAFHEELYKFLILIYFCSRHTDFNEPMDAIVYGVAVSLGFSAYENVEYVFAHLDFGYTWQEMAAVRILPTIMHGINGVIMGLLLSKVIFINRDHTRLILAFLVPVFFHGIYNLLITFLPGLSILLVLIIVIYILVSVRKMRKLQEYKIIESEIKETVNHAIIFQSIFLTLLLVILSVAMFINIGIN